MNARRPGSRVTSSFISSGDALRLAITPTARSAGRRPRRASLARERRAALRTPPWSSRSPSGTSPRTRDALLRPQPTARPAPRPPPESSLLPLPPLAWLSATTPPAGPSATPWPARTPPPARRLPTRTVVRCTAHGWRG